jgi:hypothetical protein
MVWVWMMVFIMSTYISLVEQFAMMNASLGMSSGPPLLPFFQFFNGYIDK